MADHRDENCKRFVESAKGDPDISRDCPLRFQMFGDLLVQTEVDIPVETAGDEFSEILEKIPGQGRSIGRPGLASSVRMSGLVCLFVCLFVYISEFIRLHLLFFLWIWNPFQARMFPAQRIRKEAAPIIGAASFMEKLESEVVSDQWP